MQLSILRLADSQNQPSDSGQKPTLPPRLNPLGYQLLPNHRHLPQPPTRLDRFVDTQPCPRSLLVGTVLALVKRQQLAARVPAFVPVARAEGFQPVVTRERLELHTRGMESVKHGGPGDAPRVEDVINGTISGRGQVDELDDALGGVVDWEPRHVFVELRDNPDRVCALSSG